MNFLYDVPVEATVDGIKIHYDGGEVVVVYDVSDGDVVRLTIEPLEVKVTDGFRAAVKKASKCDSSSGGGSGGGGMLKVLQEESGNDEFLDKNYNEILDAVTNGHGAFVYWSQTSEEGEAHYFRVINSCDSFWGEGNTEYTVATDDGAYISDSPTGVLVKMK